MEVSAYAEDRLREGTVASMRTAAMVQPIRLVVNEQDSPSAVNFVLGSRALLTRSRNEARLWDRSGPDEAAQPHLGLSSHCAADGPGVLTSSSTKTLFAGFSPAYYRPGTTLVARLG
jgi:hypothetical protein